MKKLFLLLMTVMLTSAVAMAQTRTVSGTVMSAADDEPLPGATVQPVGGGVGAATDIDGNFTLTVPQSVKKLTVSYIGMVAQTVDVTTDKMVIKLQPAANVLDDVIVTAYGTSTRQAFTGTAAVVGAAEIEKTQVTNVLSALNGRAPGMQQFNVSGQPGSSPSIRVLGVGSVNSNMESEPLIVLDGVPFSGVLSAINPNDVESLTVSTDAAANALYGARGANGVIYITTKRGKAGQAATVTFDAKWGANTRASQDYNTIKNPGLYYETYYNSLNNYYMSQGMSAEAANRKANADMIYGDGTGLGYQVYNVPEGELFIGLNGRLNPNATLGRLVNYNGQEYYLTPDNWLDETYSSSLRQEYNVSIASAGERSDFYTSFGYLNNEGIIKNTGFERFTGRLAANSQVKSWLKVGGDVSYSHYETKGMDGDGTAYINNPLISATGIGPIYPMYIRDGQGNIMTNSVGMIMYDFGNGDNAGLSRPAGASNTSNGMSDVRYNTYLTKGNSVNATGIVEIRLPYGFKITSKNNVYVDSKRKQALENPNIPTNVTQGGRVTVSSQDFIESTYQQLLNWSHSYGDHNVAALFGHENSYRRNSALSADRTQLFLPDVPELNNAVVKGDMSSSTASYNNEGWMFQAQYDYMNKYFGNFSFRRDASSRFDPKHRWGNFWSVGAGWIITKEDFMKDLTWVNELKFKASYGEQGNDGLPSSYYYTNRYTIVNVDNQPAVSPSTVKGNPDITWEKNGNFNTGIEFSLFNYRLTGEIDYYYRRTTGMLYSKPLAASTGYSNVYDNFGDMSNQGIMLQLNGTAISTRDWVWDIRVNLTYLRNRVEKLPATNKQSKVEGYEGTSSGGYFIGEGLPMYTWYCYDYAGVDPNTGEGLYWKDIKDADGNISGREKVTSTGNPTQYLNGSALNDVYGGFGTTLSWKSLDFSIDFAYGLGGKVMDTDYKGYMMTPYSGSIGGAVHADVLNSWSPANPNSNIPRWQWGDKDISTSNRFLTNASYLSLQNINLGYTLPASLTKKFFVEKLRVYFAAENVWLWSKRQGLDPRQSITGDASNAYYSPIRTLTGGLTLTF